MSLEVAEALDKVWHRPGIKLKTCLPIQHIQFLELHIFQCMFRVKKGNQYLELKTINAVVSKPAYFIVYIDKTFQ